jgi:hypothetical protein
MHFSRLEIPFRLEAAMKKMLLSIATFNARHTDHRTDHPEMPSAETQSARDLPYQSLPHHGLELVGPIPFLRHGRENHFRFAA